jgi:hypothetical protein
MRPARIPRIPIYGLPPSEFQLFSFSALSLPFSFVPKPIANTIGIGVAAQPHFRSGPAIAAALVRRQTRMRIFLQAHSNTLTLRGNLLCA